MGMTTCSECGGTVSTRALMCPHCGVEKVYAYPHYGPPGPNLARYIALALLGFGILILGGSC